MKFQPIIPIIWTAEFYETIDFYTKILGFNCSELNDECGWAALSRGECEIMIARPNEHTPFEKPQFTGTFYIRIDEVDALWNNLKDKAKICYELETFDWGMREFAIFDHNGYMIQFGQAISE